VRCDHSVLGTSLCEQSTGHKSGELYHKQVPTMHERHFFAHVLGQFLFVVYLKMPVASLATGTAGAPRKPC